MISPREATAGNTPPTTPRPETPSNCMGRYVEWLRDPNAPFLSKMAAAFLMGLALQVIFPMHELSLPMVFVTAFAATFIFNLLFDVYVWRG